MYEVWYVKLYCAWSSFLQKCDRRILNKTYYYYLWPALAVVKFYGTTQPWFDCQCCWQKLCATRAVNCTYHACPVQVLFSTRNTVCSLSRYASVIRYVIVCQVMLSFELQFLTSVVYACACAAVCVAAYMCVCIYMHAYICTSLSDHHTLEEETKLNFILFRNLLVKLTNFMYVCKKRRKKVQSVKNKIQVSDLVTVTNGWGQSPYYIV